MDVDYHYATNSPYQSHSVFLHSGLFVLFFVPRQMAFLDTQSLSILAARIGETAFNIAFINEFLLCDHRLIIFEN